MSWGKVLESDLIYDHLFFNVFVIFFTFFYELLSNVFVFGEGYFFKTLPTPQQGWSLNRSDIVINPVFNPKSHNQEIKKSDDQEIQKCLKTSSIPGVGSFPPIRPLASFPSVPLSHGRPGKEVGC